MFQINDKVVCVDDSRGRVSGSRELQKGKVYVIFDINPSPDFRGSVGLFLVGVKNGPGWASSRFRKLSDIKAENAAKRAGVLHA